MKKLWILALLAATIVAAFTVLGRRDSSAPTAQAPIATPSTVPEPTIAPSPSESAVTQVKNTDAHPLAERQAAAPETLPPNTQGTDAAAVMIENLDEIPNRCRHAREQCEIRGSLLDLFKAQKAELTKHPETVRGLLAYLSTQYIKNHPEKLGEILQIIDETTPEHGLQRHQMRGYAFWKTKNFVKAREQYDLMRSRLPEKEWPIGDLAVFYYEAGDYREALRFEEKIVARSKSLVDIDADFLQFHVKRIEELRAKLQP